MLSSYEASTDRVTFFGGGVKDFSELCSTFTATTTKVSVVAYVIKSKILFTSPSKVEAKQWLQLHLPVKPRLSSLDAVVLSAVRSSFSEGSLCMRNQTHVMIQHFP